VTALAGEPGREAGSVTARLLAVSHTGEHSGAEVVLRRLLRAATEAGWVVSAASPEGPMAEALRQDGVVVHLLPDLKLPSGPAPLAAAQLGVRQVVAAIRLRRPVGSADTVVVNGLLGLGALLPFRRRARVVWLVHDVIERRDRLFFLRLFRRAAGLTVAVSDATAAPLRARGLNVLVVRNGTPWPVEPMPGRPAGIPVIGCTAALTSWKGQNVLLDAIGKLRRSDVVVELLGGQFPKDGPYVDSLRRRAAAADLNGRVRFLGQQEDPLDRMRTWTVAVSASVLPEAGPLAPLEAMSIGLPLVGTNHGGTPEVLGHAGLLVPPGDAEAMASAINRLLEDATLWESCHRAGPEQIEAGLRLDQQLTGLLQVLGGAR